MKKILVTIAALLLLCAGCYLATKTESPKDTIDSVKCYTSHLPGGDSVIIKRVGDIPVPLKHIKRDSVEPGSFAEYLRNLPLKPEGYPTHLYDGSEKANKRSTFRVVDMDIDSVDLQQCADACIRLYAEYLWHSRQYDKIKFHFVSGFLADYDRWAHGERIRINAGRTQASWYRLNNQEDYSYSTFRQYLLVVFAYAGTASLPKDMEVVRHGLEIGDVIIQPGSPGHAVIVVDKAREFLLLAQSYMPAQEIEILQGRHGCEEIWNCIGSEPEIDDYSYLATPEWSFRLDNQKAFVMRFKTLNSR